ncbi:MAG: AEC family transporter [Lachnospiraceae bacterium]|nr:AEC family transporter [Lachnospiraceae bacterium]
MDIGKLMTLQGMLFLLTGIGIVIRKSKLLPEDAQGMLTDLILYVILPCNIALSFRIELNRELLQNLGIGFLVAWIVQAIAWGLSRVLYNKYPEPTKRVLQYATVCSNGGFMGNPIAESVFGATGLMYASIFLIPQRIVMWSAGVTLFTEAPDKKTLVKKVLTHPCIIAVFVGLVFMIFNPPLPEFVEKTASSLGSCTTPLSMLMVGMILADVTDIRSMFSWDVIRYTIIRLVILPGIIFIGCRIAGIDGLVTGVAVLLTAMPAACMTTILATKYHGDSMFASKCVVFSTAMTLVSLPVWCMLF